MNIHGLVQGLTDFGVKNLGLQGEDVIYTQNLIYALVKTTGAYGGQTVEVTRDNLPGVLAQVSAYAIDKGAVEAHEADSLETAVMGLISLKPSEVTERFRSMGDTKAACDWFYQYCIDNNYIRMQDIVKNKYWAAQNTSRLLEITINLSKPEKSNADIARQRTEVRSSYPKCVLCEQNIGNWGGGGYPARQNIRTIPIKLGGEDWFWQYSPYVYYDQHCIAVNCNHTPMQVSAKTFVKLMDFVDSVPHYFVGCNASLPIIGGSILNHDHFQGGRKLLPMHTVGAKTIFGSKEYKDVKVSILDWYNSVIRVEGKNRRSIEAICAKILNKWQDYSNEKLGVIAYSNEVPHNSLAPIARKTSEGYVVDMILRNNRCDETHPDGIFHAHKEYHNIKSEGIGLIEAMGLFILPARLERQSAEIAKFLTGEVKSMSEVSEDTAIHTQFVAKLTGQYGTANTLEQANSIIRDEIALVCQSILINTAVFKPDAEGERAFVEFLCSCGIVEK